MTLKSLTVRPAAVRPVGQTRNSVTCVTIEQLQRLQAELQRLAERANGLDPADCDPRRVCHLIGEPPTVSLG